MKLHWGDPKHATEIRAWTGAIGRNGRPWQHCLTAHAVRRWFGISRKRSWFFGLCLFGDSADYHSFSRPRVGYAADKDWSGKKDTWSTPVVKPTTPDTASSDARTGERGLPSETIRERDDA